MLRFALSNLLSRPLRTILALAGLIIAIASMTILFSIAAGIDAVVQRTFSQIPGLAIQERGSPLPIFSTLPAEWKTELQNFPGVAVVDSEIVNRLNVLDGKTLISPPRFLLGLDIPERLRLQRDIYRENIKEGRFLSAQDIGQRNCLISRQIASDTGKTIGDTIRLNRTDAQIIGIYDTGSMLLDVNIVLDINTVRELLRLSPNAVSAFYLEPTPETSPQELKKAIEKHYVGRDTTKRGPGNQLALLLAIPLPQPLQSISDAIQLWLSAGTSPTIGDLSMTDNATDPTGAQSPSPPVSAVEVRLAQDWSDRFSEMTGDLNLFLGLITAMGVTIALLSIVNTMIMSVSERMTEFGILRANGWSKGNVMLLMIFESAIIGIIGGLVGVIVGWGATQIINSLFPDRLRLVAGPSLLLFGAAFSAVLGILGGLYPAWRAASRSPMEAIRRG